jgi:PAS domain S-box-containing protein
MPRFVFADCMSEKTSKYISRFFIFISGLTIGFGVMVLFGWIFHIQSLKGLIPGQVAVKANAAICFVLIGMALWLAISGVHNRFASVLSRASAVMAGVIGLLSFLEYWYSWDLGIDQLLFKAGPDDLPGSIRLALMSPIAAADFFLLGITIGLLGVKARWVRLLENCFPAIAAVAAMFGVLDFVLDPQNTHTHIAPMTALLLLLCSFAVLGARPYDGLGGLLVSETVGGLLSRRLLPSAILIPIAIAWLRWRGQQVGLYSEWTGLAIMTVSAAVLLAALTIWTAVVLDRVEAKRKQAEESARRLAAIVTCSSDAIVGKTLDGIVTSWNPGAEVIYGYSAEEIVGHPVTRVISPDRLDEFHGFLQRLQHGETIRHHETERLRKDGKRISVSISISPLRDDKGRIVGASTITRDISERKQAEEDLRRAARYSRSLIEASLDPLVTISKAGKITDVNEATEKATGIPRDRLIGSDFCNYFTEPQKAREGYARVFEQGFIRDYPLAIRNISGAVMDVLYNATVFKGADGEVDDVFAAARDITGPKQSQEALNRSESRYRSLVTATAQIVWTTNREGDVVDDMPMWRAYTGMTWEQIAGSGWLNSLHPEDRTRTGQVWAKAWRNRERYETEYRIRRHDGEYRTFSVRGVPVLENEGAVREWVGTCTDITERKQAEEELRLSRERLALAQKSAHSGTFDWDMRNNINLWTPEVEEVHGLAPGEFGGTLEDWEALVLPEDLPAAIASIESSLRNGEFAGELRIRRRNDGEIRWITARAKILYDDQRQPWRMIGLNMDVTERKRAEEEVRKLNNELEERVMQRTAQLAAANKELEAFTYSVSHDLRAPLRHISGFSKILSEEFSESLPDEARHHVQRIQEGTRRMGQLVDDLLNLGRVGRKELSLQVAGLHSIVDEVIRNLKSEVGNRQVDWKIGDLPYVECDTALIEQVFQNLLSNALKFTRPRTQTVIEIGQMQKDGNPVVYVKDNGVGFSMKYADKLFGVFQRLHRVEDFEGTGVGLATVQRIIQKHGGRIWAEAELDKGASFYFTLGNSQTSEDSSKAMVAGVNS